jgi:hypothetical protein
MLQKIVIGALLLELTRVHLAVQQLLIALFVEVRVAFWLRNHHVNALFVRGRVGTRKKANFVISVAVQDGRIVRRDSIIGS